MKHSAPRVGLKLVGERQDVVPGVQLRCLAGLPPRTGRACVLRTLASPLSTWSPEGPHCPREGLQGEHTGCVISRVLRQSLV